MITENRFAEFVEKGHQPAIMKKVNRVTGKIHFEVVLEPFTPVSEWRYLVNKNLKPKRFMKQRNAEYWLRDHGIDDYKVYG